MPIADVDLAWRVSESSSRMALPDRRYLWMNSTDTSQSVDWLLHGDLHHYNVLLDSERGWLAID